MVLRRKEDYMEKLRKNAENLCQHLNKKCNIHSITESCNEKSKTIRLMFGANSLRYIITASLHTNEGEISIVSPISIDCENQATLNSLLVTIQYPHKTTGRSDPIKPS